MKHTRCIAIIILLVINPCYPQDPEKNESSSFNVSNILYNPYVVMTVSAFVIPKIVSPCLEYMISQYNHVYTEHWLTPEQKKAILQKQHEEHEQLAAEFDKAIMQEKVVLLQTDRGKNILLKREEQTLKLGQQMLQKNDLELSEAYRQSILADLAVYEQLIRETNDENLKRKLEQDKNSVIDNWIHSKNKSSI